MRGGQRQGRYPHVEGDGRAVRFMRLAEIKGVNACAAELKATVKKWCELRARSTSP